MIRRDEIKKCQEKEAKFLKLLHTKSEKLANKYLIDKRHTQLAHLPQEEADYYTSIPKRILLEKLISFLHSV